MNRPADQAWKQLTLQGNELFERGEHQRALLAYEQARSLALDNFDDWPDSDDAVAAVVVSYLNLAEAQSRTGALDAACELLCSVHASLMRASRNNGLHPLLRDAATRHLRETFAALARFQTLHGERADIHRWLCPECSAKAAAESDDIAPGRTLH
jgi:tetratricopeptide (TPR) repeat protein